MTARVAVTVHHGMRQLFEYYRRNAFTSLAIAIDFHLLAIGVYYLAVLLAGPEDSITVPTRPPVWIALPPSIFDDVNHGLLGVPITPPARVKDGFPVPVPDPIVEPEQTVPKKYDLEPPSVTGFGTEGDAGAKGLTGVQGDGGYLIDVSEDVDPPPFLPVEHEPIPVKIVQPTYPEIARRAGMEGTVVLSLLVDKQGRVKKAKVLNSNGDVFNEAAIQAGLRWVFTPAMMNSGPVAVWASVPFRFTLHK